ncbi:MAG: DUF2851 family protein [Rhodothermus sp.]|nr:DUF2851 family protein [Rhodothermus sp.]
MSTRPPEALLHDLWAHGLFSEKPLQTTTGEPIRIVHPGEANPDAGPDFLNACLLIDGTRWYGSIELHIRSSAWKAHGHHRDPRYNSVILHVVLEADATTGSLQRADGTRLPELVLAPYLPHSLRSLLYTFYRRAHKPLPCAAQWHLVPEPVRMRWLDTLGRTRLQQRAQHVQALLSQTPSDQVLYELLMMALGYAANAEPMRLLTRRLPLAMLRALPTLPDVEAVLLGTAGLLETLRPDRLLTAEHWKVLRLRFGQWQQQWGLVPLPALLWQQGRQRPANRPVRRLLQAAGWLAPGGWLRQHPIAQLEAALHHPHPLRRLRRLLRSPSSHIPLGRQRTDILLINALLPFLLARNPDYHDQLVRLLQTMPAERDRITQRFAQLSCQAATAFDSQALHQLYRAYCQRWHCLHCEIGRYLMDRAS